MGCVQSAESKYVVKRKNNVVCEICALCFNSVERVPLFICENDHNSCQVCVNSFKEKGITQCPFCRVDIDFKSKPNRELL